MQYLFLSEGSCFNSEKQGPSSEQLSVPTAPATTLRPGCSVPSYHGSPEKPGLGCASSIKQLTWFQVLILSLPSF